MHVLRTGFTRFKYALIATALAAGAFVQVAPAGATQAPGPVSINFGTCDTTGLVCTGSDNFNVATVVAGNDIAVDVFATNTSTNIARAWQFGVSYTPATVTLTSVGATAGAVNYSDEYLRNVGGGTSVTGIPGTIDNTLGSLSVSGDSLLGGTATSGATGTGRLATLHFHAVALGTAGLTLAANSHLVGTSTVGNLVTNLGTTNLNVGPVAAPNLVVQSPSTVAVATPPGAAFNVTFIVANTGTAASTATTATVAATNATPPATPTAAVAALAAGANTGTLTVGPFTLTTGQTLSSVTISVPGATSATTAYSFAAFTSSGTTTVNAAYGGFLQLTPPGANSPTFTAGQTNTFGGVAANDSLNVRSNLSSWSVTVAGDNTGHFHEFDPAAASYVATGGQLINPLSVATGTTIGPVALSGSPQSYVTGTRANSNPTTGNSYVISYTQPVGFNDQPVNPPHTYRIVITWAAAGVF